MRQKFVPVGLEEALSDLTQSTTVRKHCRLRKSKCLIIAARQMHLHKTPGSGPQTTDRTSLRWILFFFFFLIGRDSISCIFRYKLFISWGEEVIYCSWVSCRNQACYKVMSPSSDVDCSGGKDIRLPGPSLWAESSQDICYLWWGWKWMR